MLKLNALVRLGCTGSDSMQLLHMLKSNIIPCMGPSLSVTWITPKPCAALLNVAFVASAEKDSIRIISERLQRFGHGSYLAPHSSKCHDYTRGSHTHRAMLLCDVLPGKKHVVTTDHTHLTTPPQDYDSVYGQPDPGCLNYPEIVI